MLSALLALSLAPGHAHAGVDPDEALSTEEGQALLVAGVTTGADEPAVDPSAAMPSDGAVGEDAPLAPPVAAEERRPGRKGRPGGRGGGDADRRGKGPGGKGPGGERGGADGPAARGIWAHVRPVGLLQVWGTAYDMDQDPVADATGYGDAEDDTGFKLKRARLGLEGGTDGLDWALVFGVTAPYDGFDEEDGSIQVVDAHVGYSTKALGVTVGQGELPFSRDLMISAADQTFTERGFVAEHIAPARNLGASVWGSRWGGKATVGVYNSGGGLFGDDNLGKTFVGRLEYARGDASVYETWGGPKTLAFGIGGGGFMTDDVSTSTRALGADAILRVAGLTVLVDGAWGDSTPTRSDLDVPGVWALTTRRGLTGQLGYAVAAFEPTVKVSFFEDSALGSYTQGMFGIVWHGLLDEKKQDRLRVGAGYVLRVEDEPIQNDSVRVWIQARP